MTIKERIDGYFEGREAAIVRDASRLIAVRSVREEPLPGMPFGRGLADALALALGMVKELGLASRNFDNYVGTADLNDRETRLGILAHLDVVGEGAGWSSPPYAAYVKDGMLYGRGAQDDKGPLVAALYAMKAVRDLGLPLRFNARLIMGTDEETDSADLAYYAARERFPPMTFSPDASFPVINGEKGHFSPVFEAHWAEGGALPRVRSLKGGYRVNVVPPEAEALVEGLPKWRIESACEAASRETKAEFLVSGDGGAVKIAVKGRAAHASTPQEGNNALTALLRLLCSLTLADSDSSRALRALNRLFPHGDCSGKAAGIAMSEPIMGELTLAFSLLELDLVGLRGRFDARAPLCASRGNTVEVIEPALARAGISVVDPKLLPPHFTSPDSPLVKALLAAYEAYTGLGGACLSMGGGTYVHNIEGGVAFGCSMPGFDPSEHAADEHAEIKSLLVSAKIFAHAIADLCS